MGEVKILSADALAWKPKQENENYGYEKANFVSRADSSHSRVNMYRISPRMAAYPYHYHLQTEETFYIISGEGLLRTPGGERRVKAGDLIFFPAGEQGAHKLENDTDNELVYLDFDVEFVPDVAFYPDSDKIGIYAPDCHLNFRVSDAVDYYDGESD